MNLSPLGGILLGSIPASAKLAIFDCPIGDFVCADTDTLAQAKAAGAIKQNAKLQDLGYYKDANGQDITLKNLVKGLPPDTTLEDLLATVLLKTAYDWETLPLPGFPLQDFSTDGGTVTYTVSVLLNGAGPPVDSTIGVHLPADARYVPNSTTLSGGPGTVDGEPTLQSPENELTWHVNGLALDTSYELSFHAKPGLSLGTEDGDREDRRDRPRRNRHRAGSGGHADHRARRAGERAAQLPLSRRSPTRSTSATRRAAPTATTSRSMPIRVSS